MISLLPALACKFLLAGAGSQQGQPLRPMPVGVILSASGDDGSFLPLMNAADKIKSLRIFEKFEDELLCSKQGEGSYIFVKKSFPAYVKLRLRTHVLSLLAKKGYTKAFEYQELATPEFEPYLRSMWWNTPEIVPNPATKLAFRIQLRTSATVAGTPLQFPFAPMVRFSDQVKNELIASPAAVLTDRNQIEQRAKTLAAYNAANQYRLMRDTPVAQEVPLVRDALENFRTYFDAQSAKIDDQVEAVLTDPIWDETKTRRKAKDMRDLKANAPKAFNFMLNFRKEELSYFDKVPSTEETLALQEAPLTHQYTVVLALVANGKNISVNLPI